MGMLIQGTYFKAAAFCLEIYLDTIATEHEEGLKYFHKLVLQRFMLTVIQTVSTHFLKYRFIQINDTKSSVAETHLSLSFLGDSAHPERRINTRKTSLVIGYILKQLQAC